MRIKTVTLGNIRSHVESTVNFERGFNCLVGGLGTGKSSILYAIDFALFGDPLTRSYHYLLREGESEGKVAVEFLSHSKTFRIERGLKRRGNGISQDVEHLKFFEEDNLIASMRNEAVAEQLKAITGLDKEIFREVVWVRQEHLKELLDVAPRERQKRLDQLFELSDYETAWNNIRGIQNRYAGEKEAYSKDLDVLEAEKLEVDYHEAARDFLNLENEIQDLTNQLHKADTAMQTASSQLQSLEQLRRQTEELLKKEAELQTHIANTEDMSARLVNQVQKRADVTTELEQRLKNFEAQLLSQREQLQEIGLAPDATIDELKDQLASFEEQVTSIMAEREAATKETQVFKQRASSLSAESRCPLCLQSLTEDYKAHVLKHFEDENTERERKLKELQKNIQEVEQLRNVVGKAVLDLQSYIPRIRDMKARVAEEKKSKQELEKEFEESQLREKKFGGQLKETRKEIAKFDMSKLEAARKLYDTTVEHYHTTKTRLESAETRKKDVSSRIENLRERLEHAHQKIDRGKKIEKILETLDGIRNAYRSIQPKLRKEFIKILERVVQQMIDNLVSEEGAAFTARIDETYTPSIQSQEGSLREVTNLSGGERTLLAFAYRFALGQLIMQARAGHGLQLLLLDEPTESLGREDRSVDRLAEAIARLKAIEQIIAVTHNEVFAEKAEHVIRLEKEAEVSRIIAEK